MDAPVTWLPHKTVATVIQRNGRFLMVEETDNGRTVFNQPAGHLEAGETLVEAAARETLEETGWEVSITAFLGLYHYRAEVDGETYIRSCFIGQPVRPIPEQLLDPDIIAVHWFTLNELRQHRASLRSPVVMPAIHDYLNGICYPLTIISSVE
jgi:8-oxo-dGTP pyrophosphatase MutT (NUDIX family)